MTEVKKIALSLIEMAKEVIRLDSAPLNSSWEEFAETACNAAPALAAALLRAEELLRETIDLAWAADSREVQFDDTVMFGKGYDFGGLEGPSRQEFLAKTNCVVWPAYGFGAKWSAYCEHEGALWFERFETDTEAKGACMDHIAALIPDHPAIIARAFLASLKEPQQ